MYLCLEWFQKYSEIICLFFRIRDHDAEVILQNVNGHVHRLFFLYSQWRNCDAHIHLLELIESLSIH